jgi:Cytochrome P460
MTPAFNVTSKGARVKKVLIASLFLVLLLGLTSVGAQQSPQTAAPVFEGKTTLQRPVNYREWVFVGSSLGLSYAANPPAQGQTTGMGQMYHNVYIKPESYREFAKTGKFPEGTVLAMEMASADTKREPGLQGSYEKEFVGLEVSVKDSSRFEGGWAYFNFSDGMGSSYKAKAEPFPASAGCVSCHKQNAETDNVFTQFYPVLRAAKAH